MIRMHAKSGEIVHHAITRAIKTAEAGEDMVELNFNDRAIVVGPNHVQTALYYWSKACPPGPGEESAT